ncbi:MAG: hypothetical protein ACRC7N_08440, partial [Clostridium sp.]
MSNYLTEIPKDTFKKVVPIYFENILEGFDSYSYKNLSPSSDGTNKEEMYVNLFLELYNLYKDSMYIDLYLDRLNEDSLSVLRGNLSKDDMEILEELIEENYVSPFFKIEDEKVIPLLVRLSTRELFFTSFYFKDFTIWGSYNYTFPIFFKDEN